MNQKSKSIDRIHKNLILSIFITLIVGISTIVIISEYYQYRKNVSFDKELIEDEKKLFLKIAVNNVTSYLHFINASSEDKMHQKLEDAVNNAYSQAESIYQKNKEKGSLPEIKQLIKEVLRENRYFNGRGYIYIVDMDGVLQMHPHQTELEGKSLMGMSDSTGVYFIKEQVDLMRVSQEAYHSYSWPKGWKNDSVFYKKTSFIKKIEDFNWFIGCGEYTDDHIYETQQMALEWLRDSYSADDWNLFINHYDGTSIIINSAKYKAGVNIKDISDNNGLKIFEKELQIARSNKSDYLYYNWPKNNNEFISKVAYVSGFNEWNWMIGASSSLAQFDAIELHKTKSLYQSSRTRILLVLLLSLPLLIYIFSQLKRNSKQLSTNLSFFITQFENALDTNQTIDSNQFKVEELSQLSLGVNQLLLEHFENVKALTGSEEKFRVLVENAPLVIVGVDNHGVVKLWNKQSELFFNLTQKEVLNKPAPLSSLFPDSQTSIIKEKISNETGEFKLTPIQLKTGETAFQYWASFRISEDLLIWIGNDVTALKKAENELSKSRNFLNTLLESIPSPVFYKDVSGKYMGGNQSFFELTGKSPDEVIGKGVHELYSKELADVYFQKDLMVLKGDSQKYDSIYRANGKDFKNFTFYKAPFKNEQGEVIGLIGVMLDISERIKIENQLKKNQIELEKLNATKDKFFSIIAHDLINPFNTMLNAGELLTENLLANNYEEAKKMAGFLNPAMQRGYDLLLNLLEWSRTQTGTIKYTPENLLIGDELIKTVQLAQDMANMKSIELIEQYDFNPLVSFDPNMLRTIVRNLISNAIKFTEDKGKIIVETSKQDEYIKISIIDNGVGMDESTVNSIFNLNKANPSRGTKGEPGTGLGMVLVKEFVEKHMGHIEIGSELNKGTTVSILLPLS